MSRKVTQLTHELALATFDYDALTGVICWKIKRRGHVQAGDVAGTVDAHGYLNIMFGSKLYKAHRLAWFIATGVWPTSDLDHINGVRTDNRWENLRLATVSENQQNLGGPRANNKCGHLGVFFNKQCGKFQAGIWLDGKRTYLGLFSKAKDASAAYLAAKIVIHTHNDRAVGRTYAAI